jgi:hypothetical protein
VQGVFGVPKLALESAAPERWLLGASIAAAFCVAMLWMLWHWGGRLPRAFGAAAVAAEALPKVSWLALVLGIGLVLRVVVVVVWPAEQASDHAAYFELARRLAAGESFTFAGTHSWWPPGLPFALAPAFMLFGPTMAVVYAFNAALYVGMVLLIGRIGRQLDCEAEGRLAQLIVALWPNLLFAFGLVKKEMLLLVLMLGLASIYLSAVRAPTMIAYTRRMITGGALLGAACLAQPSLLLFPAAVGMSEFLRGARARIVAIGVAAMVAGMILVISPWTWRNYQVLEAFVPITTTGGENFYSANNPLATGGWIPDYPLNIRELDELTANRVGYQLGIQWIRDNPSDFLLLALRKQLLEMGDDSDSAYWVFNRGNGWSGLPYLAVKGISSGYWLLLLLGLLAGLYGARRHESLMSPHVLFFALSLLYFHAIDSVFQSGSRHHVPVAGYLAVLLPLLLRNAAGYAALSFVRIASRVGVAEGR